MVQWSQLLWPGGWGAGVLIACLALAGSLLVRRLVLTANQVKREARGPQLPDLVILLLVRNQEEQIEGFLRSLLDLVRHRCTAVDQVGLVMVDVNSTDQSVAILHRLAGGWPQSQVICLEAADAGRACELALEPCGGRLTLLVDLRSPVDGGRLLHRLATHWK